MVLVGKAGPVMRVGEFDVTFDGYGGTVEVSVDPWELSYTEKNRDPLGVNITAYLDVATYESSDIDNDWDMEESFERAASHAIGVPVKLVGPWYEVKGTRDFEPHMHHMLSPAGHFRIAAHSEFSR